VGDAVDESILEEFMDEEVVCPEVYDLLKELALETLQKTSNRVRREEIKEVKK
jgi:hypothetical protein